MEKERDLLEEARCMLGARFGYDTFLPGQEEALASVFSGRNLLVVMPTGSGKSIVYQLPAVVGTGLTIVVSPLISLMKDQVDELTRIGVPATSVNSSLDRAEQRSRLAGCARGDFRLLYIAPERCRDQGFLAMLERVEVSRLAVDEAHCISEWGHDFRPDYRRLKAFRERIGLPPTIALTATATARVRRDIVESLGLDPDATDVHVHGFDRPNLALSVFPAADDSKKMAHLLRFLRRRPGPGIIYAGTRKQTEAIASGLKSVEPSIVSYHAGMEPEARSEAQEAFLAGRARVVAATSAFGMGIDKSDVRFVIHYGYPGSVEQYYQEIGRAGRDGLDSECVLLYSSSDRGLREFFIDMGYPGRKQVESVWNTLWAIGENPVLLTYREIADRCEGRLSEGQVGSAVRMLQAAGAVRAYEGEPCIAVTLDRPYARIRPLVRGEVQRRLLEALASSFDLEEPGRFEIGLHRLAGDAGLSVEQARRALAALREGGVASYEAPFRGRGVEITNGRRVPFDSLEIDWKRHDLMRRLEEEKLRAIERFVATPGCRRGFILSYFGERDSFTCDRCDNCARSEAGGAESAGILERQPEVALPVLTCVRFLRFPVGKGKVADIVTGSRNKQLLEWQLDGNPAYGTVRCRTGHVKDVIECLLLEGYLYLSVESGFPVLELTGRGREAAAGFTRARLEELAGQGAGARAGSGARTGGRGARSAGGAGPGLAARRRSASGEGRPRGVDRTYAECDAAVVRTVLRCVDELPFALGVTKLAAVLTGSRQEFIQKNGIDRLSTYGAVDATQKRVRNVIISMVEEDLLAYSGSPERPTLKLAPRGRAELAEK